MTNESSHVLVLRDEEGNYYRISHEVIEANRVPEEEKSDLEAALSQDTGGFLIPMSFFRPQFPASAQPSGQPKSKVSLHDISFTTR